MGGNHQPVFRHWRRLHFETASVVEVPGAPDAAGPPGPASWTVDALDRAFGPELDAVNRGASRARGKQADRRRFRSASEL
eukprot:4347181-Pyramimonas_sp.AAC.1